VCGRYASTKDPANLAAEFDAVDQTDGERQEPDYNVAPTKPVLSVVTRHPRNAEGIADPDTIERGVRVMRWGLIPHWAKEKGIGAKMINARSESAATKPAFKSSVARRRCVLPADGWYEWRRELDADGKTVKLPFFMTRTDGASIPMAGIWSAWHDPKAEPGAPPVISCAVLTTAAAGRLTTVHDRMPLLLPENKLAEWLDPDRADVAELLAAPDLDLAEALELRPVSQKVNNVRNRGPELLERVEPEADLALFDVAPK
jgi:putative SOS response-associated peptidase YedK